MSKLTALSYEIDRLVVTSFRGIDAAELRFSKGVSHVIVGANNAGKSTLLDALALVLNAAGTHQFAPSEDDFHLSKDGERAREFTIELAFRADAETDYPAVRGVGPPVAIGGVRYSSKRTDRSIRSRRVLLDLNGAPVMLPDRTPMAKKDKETWSGRGLDYRRPYAKLDEIREHLPELWKLTPQNIEASLFVWKTGPLARLSKYLADRFLEDEWELSISDGVSRPMPESLKRAHSFLTQASAEFPFWKDDLKPNFEGKLSEYVGAQAKVELSPSIASLRDWLAELLSISLASDEHSPATPLERMGDGWMSLVRLATLEVMADYPALAKERRILLLEEAETHLHPHLRRKLRSILRRLAESGWTVVTTTHSAELVSIAEPQIVARANRTNGKFGLTQVSSATLPQAARVQAKIDERGSHEFIFSNAVVFCEGRDDEYALRRGLELRNVELDARSVSIMACGSITAIPDFAELATQLGIRWCAVTDEDVLDNGDINPNSEKVRLKLEKTRGDCDLQTFWPGCLERCFNLPQGKKARPEIVLGLLPAEASLSQYASFEAQIEQVLSWINQSPHPPAEADAALDNESCPGE